MLTQEQKQQFVTLILNSAACPATVYGELNAFREGIASAVEILSKQITMSTGGATEVDSPLDESVSTKQDD